MPHMNKIGLMFLPFAHVRNDTGTCYKILKGVIFVNNDWLIYDSVNNLDH